MRSRSIEVTCECCGKGFSVYLSRAKMYNVRACSRVCLGVIQSAERKGTFGVGDSNPMWRGGRHPAVYRRHLKDSCERCGSEKHLLIHHKDEDRGNNSLGNLETLCKRCHQLHHGCIGNLPQYNPR